jgi:hypothetical protein
MANRDVKTNIAAVSADQMVRNTNIVLLPIFHGVSGDALFVAMVYYMSTMNAVVAATLQVVNTMDLVEENIAWVNFPAA